MAIKHRARGGSHIKCNLLGDVYFYFLEFEANDTSAPDGVAPSGGVTLGYSDVGDLTITFDENIKPKNVMMAIPVIAENNALGSIKCADYVPSTGVLPVHTYTDDGTSGVPASDDLDDVTFRVLILCNDSELGDR
tara:strand:+ start:14392 stop:14796 length:405 start_codon:yes stop_codon:yes gene_type:complete